ncbi:GNAT family N-acetyltransferase [Prochlorococcus marinus]|uniref:GNAT family N-acetyltransferase n=1 Tax=Prochlorococcus marinus TaxID=1219 RepID=UPI00164EE080|nr:GNAT family N-acetyltransferase [Prochlorococcus marinus]
MISKIANIEEHLLFINSELNNSNSTWFAYFEKIDSIQLPRIIGCSSLYNYSANSSSVSLGRLMVDPSFTSLGIASKLIKYSVDYAKNKLNCKTINLIVKNSNHRAIKIYERFGFELLESDESRKYILKI